MAGPICVKVFCVSLVHPRVRSRIPPHYLYSFYSNHARRVAAAATITLSVIGQAAGPANAGSDCAVRTYCDTISLFFSLFFDNFVYYYSIVFKGEGEPACASVRACPRD